MLNPELKDEILDAIAKQGKTEQQELKINTNISDVLSLSSGAARVQSSCARKSNLILSKPQSLAVLDSLQIRCILCKRVIKYPCWYYKIKYAVNSFHYFICFDSDSPMKPSVKCYRKE